MGVMDEYNSSKEERKKKKKKETEQKSGGSIMGEYYASKESNDIAPVKTTTPLFVNKTASLYAPVAPTTKATATTGKEEDKRKWFEKGAFEDGYQFGDVFKTILGTDKDADPRVESGEYRDANFWDVTWRSLNRGYDNARYGEESYKAMTGNKNKKQELAEILADDEYKYVPSNILEEGVSGAFELLGQQVRQWTHPRTMVAVGTAAGAAAIAGQAGPQVVVPEEVITVPAAALIGLKAGSAASSLEIEAGHAYNEMLEAGISEKRAKAIAMGVGTINAGLDLFQSDELIDAWKITNKSGATKTFSKRILDELKDRGIDVAKETVQEVAQEGVTITGTQLASKTEKGEWAYSADEVTDRLKDTAVSSALSFGMMNVPAAASHVGQIVSDNTKSQKLTENEQKVVDKEIENRIAEKEKDGKKLTNKEKTKIYDQVIEDMAEGDISIDTIESVLAGEEFQPYKEMIDEETAIREELEGYQTEHENLSKKDTLTLEETVRKNELEKLYTDAKAKLDDADRIGKRDYLKANLDKEVYEMTKGSKLTESFYENVRAQQKFEADVTKYEGKGKALIQSAIDSDALDNTRKMHKFIDTLANIANDSGRDITVAKQDKLLDILEQQAKDEGRAFDRSRFDGKIIDGVRTQNGIILNPESKRALNFVAGHEITHTLEKSGHYKGLFDALMSYGAEEYQKRFDERAKQYEGIYADENYKDVIDMEVAADMVGDYLFTDYDFVSHLSAKHQNVFQKVWSEIKHLCKLATAGSQELRELERVKKLFEQAYRESGKAQTDTKYSLENGNKRKYNKRSRYNETETLFLSWENSSAPVGEVKRFVRFGKVRYYEKTDSGCVELSKSQYNERRGLYVENTYGRAEREIGKATDYDGSTQRGLFGYPDSNRYTGGNAAVFGQTVREELQNDTGRSTSGALGYDSGNDIKQAEYSEEASDESGASFTFSNDYAAVRNFMKEGDTAGEADIAPVNYSLSDSDGKQPADKDIRFSLSESVEQTKDLVALHNLTAEKLTKSLQLGGLPMPSLAITKADIPHSNFGDITLIFGRETIDPKVNRKNKVYSADAWTPVFPRVEYEADSKVSSRISQKLRSLEGSIDDTFHRDIQRLQYGYEDYMNSDGGEEGLIRRAMDNYGLKAAYLEEQGKHINKVTKQQEAEKTYNPDAAERYLKIMDILGVTTPEEVGNVNMRYAADQHGAELEAIYPGVTKSAMRMGRILNAVKSYLEDKDGSPVYHTVTDINATKSAVDEALDAEGYEAWVRDLFSGIVKDSGIYNNKELFTPSGNRRSFKQTHLPVTLENIVKAMAGQNDGNSKNVSGFNGVKTLRAATAETFKSVDQMHQRKERLQNRTQEEAAALNDELQNRLFKVMEAIDNESGNRGDSNPYIRLDSIGETLAEIGESGKFGIADIQSVFQQYGKTISDDTAMEVKQLLYDVQQMPVNIFEAKPERVVGFDEAKVFVIPNNADVKLKQELLNRGYSIAEYDPNIEGHRQQVVNQFEEYKFSLSNVGEQFAPYGNWNVYNRYSTHGKDIRLEAAPVREDVAGTTAEAMFPDDIAPFSDDPERFDSLTDEDAPPVRNVEYGEHGNQMTMPKSTVNMIAQNVKASLWVEDGQMGDVRKLIEEYGNQEFPSREQLFRNLKDNFGTHTEKMTDEETQEVKRTLRRYRLNVSDAIKSEITDYGYLRQRNFGKVLFSRQGMPVDAAYEELSEMYPGYFPKDIINPADQLLQIIEVANTSHINEQTYYLDDETIWDITDDIIESVRDYQSIQRAKDAGRTNKDYLDDLVKHGDEYAPVVRPSQSAPSAFSTDGELAPMYDAQPGRGVADGQQAMFKDEPVTEEERKQTRKQLHQGIVDSIKETFKTKGFDFDKVLKKAKNLSTFSTVDNMPQRVMEKALGYKEGQVLSDLTVNKVAQNETEGIKWLNSFTDRKNGLLKQISNQYHIKPGSKESAAAQMYAEGFYVAENNDIISYGDAELAKDFPDANVQRNIKGLAADPRIRQIYDDTLEMINESRKRNAYPEIQKLDNYFLHFRAMDDTFSKLGLPFNPNDIRAKDLPTDLNGVTADLKPGQPYFASAMHRTGKRTSFDLLGGLERYLNSAKNQIYHIDDIQTLRALRNYIADTYGQANGLEGLDALSEEEAQERIEKVYNSHLSTFAKFLNEEANILAGKTALIDRGLEGIIGRRGITFLDTVNKQVGSNMVGFNISSSLTNFLPVAQTFAKSNKADFVKAFSQTVANKLSGGRFDSFTDDSPVVIRRKGADRLYRTPWQKAGDAGYVFMSAVDDISTELIARTKYNELTRKGMDAQQAHYETDKWVSRLMGDRSLGQMPQLYNSKMLGLFTKFQLEVRNQLDAQFYDTIHETKVSNEHIENGLARNAKIAAKVTSTFVQLAVVQHLFGKAFESVAGYNPAFDIISVLMTAFGFDDEEDSEDTALDNIEQAFLELLGDLPYTSTLTGGRIPISSAMPITELVKGEDEWGNEKSRWETLGEIAPYYLLPGGYGQVKKTKQGLEMFSDDLPIAGSYTDSGNLRFPVEDTIGNRVQAGIFGQWASENARDYFDNERSPLKEKQIQEFIDVDIPIRDYWEYREGLSGLSKLEDKADYIAGLDLPIDKKNLLINNIADREEDINLEGYDDFGDFEEFDFAVKNPEKYEIAQKVGGYDAYMKYQEGMKDMKLAEKVDYVAGLNLTTEQKNALINGETDRKEPIDLTGYNTSDYSSFEEFEFAKEYPEKYAVAKAVGGYEAYKGYSSELYDIHADKDKYGKSINGSRKEKVLDYINNLDADYYTRIILWKSEYPSDDSYNNEIIEYLNGRDDISFDETIAILRKLGFKVTDDGYITW